MTTDKNQSTVNWHPLYGLNPLCHVDRQLCDSTGRKVVIRRPMAGDFHLQIEDGEWTKVGGNLVCCFYLNKFEARPVGQKQ